MALNLTQKQDVVAEVAEIAAKAHSLIAAEYAGTTVSQMTEMRKKARENGVYLKVVKNTLAARAVAGTEYEVVQDKLVGPLLYAFSLEEPGAAGRLIKECALAATSATSATTFCFWDRLRAISLLLMNSAHGSSRRRSWATPVLGVGDARSSRWWPSRCA